jgi:hypothetical protein
MSEAEHDQVADNDGLEVTVVVHPVDDDEELRERQMATIVRLLRRAAERRADVADDGA